MSRPARPRTANLALQLLVSLGRPLGDIAVACGVRQSQASQWHADLRVVPARYVPTIHALLAQAMSEQSQALRAMDEDDETGRTLVHTIAEVLVADDTKTAADLKKLSRSVKKSRAQLIKIKRITGNTATTHAAIAQVDHHLAIAMAELEDLSHNRRDFLQDNRDLHDMLTVDVSPRQKVEMLFGYAARLFGMEVPAELLSGDEGSGPQLEDRLAMAQRAPHAPSGAGIT
jgi:hypothetical protein